MLAIRVHTPGGPESLMAEELPLPLPGAGQVRVRAAAIGAGRPDVLIRTGVYKWMPPLPAVPGNELAGSVDALGEGVTGLALGDRVLVSSRELPERGGCYAQAVCVPADGVYRLPDGVDFDAAVSLPNFQLAQALLFGCGGVEPSRSVLLTGAAGGVASAMVQLARSRGLRVVATASTEAKRRFVASQGADVTLDPADAELPAKVRAATEGRGVDLAVDALGGRLFIACLRSLAPLGTAVSYNVVTGLPEGDVFQELRALLGRSLGVRVFSMHTFDADPVRRRGLMNAAIEAMAAGRLHVPPATVLPLAEVREAHRLLDGGDLLGKLILRP
jgi:NADPH2:quinone reductase